MTDFTSKTAFITGAASGIGLALTKEFLSRGAHVMMTDINAAELEKEAGILKAAGANIATCICDVSDAASVKAAADATIAAFGKVHIVVNNAGVSLAGPTGRVDLKDWQWIVDINLMGVVYGVEIFTPLIKSHGEGGHIINTASMAGHGAMATMGPYNATKFAVVGYSEALAQELSPQNIHVSVLCPTWIQTKIAESSDFRPSNTAAKDQKDSPFFQHIKSLVDNGMTPELYAKMVAEAAIKKQLYVFNDPEMRAAIDKRRDHIIADFNASLKILEDLT